MKTFIIFCTWVLAVSASPFSFLFGQNVPHHSPGYGWSSLPYNHYSHAETPPGPQTVENVPPRAHPNPSGHPGLGHNPADTTPGYPTSTMVPPNTTALPPAVQVQTQIKPSATSPEHKPKLETSLQPNATSASGYGTQRAHPQLQPPAEANVNGAPAPALPETHPGAPDISGHAIGHHATRDQTVFEHIDAYMRAIQDHLDAHEKAHNGKAGTSAHFHATKKAAEDHAFTVHAIATAHRRIHPAPSHGAPVAVPSATTATTSFYY